MAVTPYLHPMAPCCWLWTIWYWLDPPAGIDWRSLKSLRTRGNLTMLQMKWPVPVKQVIREELVENRETIRYQALLVSGAEKRARYERHVFVPRERFPFKSSAPPNTLCTCLVTICHWHVQNRSWNKTDRTNSWHYPHCYPLLWRY